MGHNLLGVGGTTSKSGLRILIKQLTAQVTSIFTKEWIVELGVAILDISEKFLLIFAIKWWLATQHFVYDTSEGPPVTCLTMAHTLKDFGSQILSSTADGFGLIMSLDILL